MVYLVIMLLVGAVGLSSLVVQQRRERAHLGSVDGFRESLSKIAPEALPGPFRQARVGRRPNPNRTPGRPIPMTASQREQARRRVEARRRARSNGRQRSRSGAVRRAS